MHVNVNTRSQSTPTCISDSSIHLTILRERTSATSGTTNSDSAQGLGACTETWVDTERTSQFNDTHVKTSMLSLSYCSSLTDPGCAPANVSCQLCGIQQPSGTSIVPASMSSGIGLHLNSLTGSMPLSQSSSRETDRACGSAACLRSVNAVVEVTPPSGLYGTLADKHGNFLSSGNSGNSLQAGSTASFRQGLAVSRVEKTTMGECDVQSKGSEHFKSAMESVTCVCSVNVGIKQLEETVLSNGLEKKTSPLGHKRVLLPDVPCQTDFNAERGDSGQSPQSPKKKRKSASTAEKFGDVCKRCNCKKSKCLKLYCECFAAGVYCVDSCSCHGCYNKPKFENKVLEIRQQIESRNPLAFAPKIVRVLAADLSPTTGEKINGDTPASARHKRGCNCKKSKCLKKYCECYQASVGCSDGCRCENCQNLYGRKEGSEDSEDNDIQTDMAEKEAAEEQMDTSEFCHELTHASQLQHNDLSPITPSFQYTGQLRSVMMSQSASKRCFSDEELQSSALLLSSSKPPKSPSWLLRSSKEAQNSFGVPVPSTGRHLPSSPILNPKILRIGQFSPRWDGLDDICTLTPLPQAPLRPAPASVSIVDGADSSPSFNKQQCNDLSSSGNGFARNNVKLAMSNNLKLARCSLPTCRHQALHSSINSHHSDTPVDLQSTPMTSIFNASLCELDNKTLYENSKDSCPKFVGLAEDGITPEILKDPVCLLKTSSPKQKRVFPPHHQGSMEASHRGLQSPGFRSGRKLKLHWIPSVLRTTYSGVHEQVNEKRSKSES